MKRFNCRLNGFTLIELLVVITIIGILVSLITIAAVSALTKTRETRIKAEINQLDEALVFNFKNKRLGYPPNCQIDGTFPKPAPIPDFEVYYNLKRYFSELFPRHQEPDDLIKAFVEIDPFVTEDYPDQLSGGLSANEALVFWLGGFSDNERYPISDDAGPAYRIPAFGKPDNRKLDPIESRKWAYPFDVTRLGPRSDDGYFDESQHRYIEYRDSQRVLRRINFWRYRPHNSTQPYLYFDTSRHPAIVIDGSGKDFGRYDPPAVTIRAGRMRLRVHAFKKRGSSTSAGVPISFMNAGKFQIIHCGLDDEWGEDDFLRMWSDYVQTPKDSASYLLFPDGRFDGAIADTIVNFTAETTIDEAQE